MQGSIRRAVYGPLDGTVLSQQSQHRSDDILDGDIDEVLQAKRADGNLVLLLYLAKLEDIVAARNYSWGSVVLAFLYRELCNASEKGKVAIGGALQLVQFIWQPYDMESNVIMAYVRDFNPQLWRSICPLIFYAIVEMHHSERVRRQFGMMQNIPDQPDTRDMSLHKITRSNRTGTDWVLQHILYITRWQRR
ncbi:UNVERIFIED_CONTAM: protein MAINTENANCE OF MERISTEMS [Sesamum angustifolium]|uniref:Protein MAINTENANCE OF MERISTEMS n=1 Tax=Sesamum angustifolium TaxID=2727405 RepID=A0AAW2KYV1_9LAMI